MYQVIVSNYRTILNNIVKVCSSQKLNKKGSALLISLVVLVAVTFLGFFSIDSSNTEQNLAGNERMTNVSFNIAEAGTQDGLSRMIAYFPAIPPDFMADNGPLSERYYVSYSYLSPALVRGYSLEQHQGYEYEVYSTALSITGDINSFPTDEVRLDVLQFIESSNPKE